MTNYTNAIGERIQIAYKREYGDLECVIISVRDGWNDSCSMLHNRMSLEELRDLRYLIDRTLANAKKSHR